jgi:hypothetical protein
MDADKDRATTRLLSVGLEPPDGDHKQHQETGVSASQNLRSSAFICGSLLPASQILPWLNALPEVRAVLAKYFDGSPIIEQNLSRWRHGGYAGWFENQLVKEAVTTMGAAGRGIDQAEREALTSQLATALSARMVLQLRHYDEMPEGPAKTAAWKDLVWSLTLLRRGEFYAGKLRLEQEKLAPKKPKAGKAPACEQEEQEQRRQIMGLGGPRWNNFAKQWEGEGAAEMTEKQEVECLVVAEYLRRKEAKEKDEGRRMKDEVETAPCAAAPEAGPAQEEKEPRTNADGDGYFSL